MENTVFDLTAAQESLLNAALTHVAFDGWSDACLKAAAVDAGIAPGLVRIMFPRGAVDLAAAYHRRGDREMVARLAASNLAGLRFREKVTLAVRLRLEVADRDVVRRGMALFSLPPHMATGAALVWGTADAIWTALGDTSTDVNWYTKRATVSGVYSATVLYWLGDESAGRAATWGFLDRRIEDVMRFEKAKADFRASPLAKILAGPLKLLDRIKAPASVPTDLPGQKG